MSEKQKQALLDVFKAIDSDKSGFIELGELEKLVQAYYAHPDCPDKKTSDAEIKAVCQDFLKECDSSKDNKISQQEFLDFFLK